ncbi:LysR family transcriptional regulator [uncultured Bartonella sp.]|uniref:LysR family transcriptional regulator n=1 Tax=uncultured Bartonella sp. TaxID=104108 RepID=UPI0025F795CA|nr:LysR family transcriptional regulator [uncultured Bartonella sp.]
MMMEDYNDLAAFVLVAQEKSFTRAAAMIGVSQSALSQTIKALEERMGLRLLNRTTRSVAPTEIGEKLLSTLVPRFEDIKSSIDSLKQLREKPAGTIKISAGEHAALTILRPAFDKLLTQYPDINIELIVDYGLINIVEQRFDAGVRLGEQIDKDMLAVKIGPDMEMAVVGSPDYFKSHKIPEIPQDLINHNCIILRSTTTGGLFAWEFDNGKNEIKVHVSGQLVFNNLSLRLQAALRGHGLTYIPEDYVRKYIEQGRLTRVLKDWCVPFTGYHLYYPNRKNLNPALSLVADALRYNG